MGKQPVTEKQSITQEQEPQYINSFEELAALGATGFDGGEKVSFQPYHRYEEGRQIGTVRLWEEDPDVISIPFQGSKAGVPYPDGERVTKQNFDERKDVWKIRKED